MADYGRKWTKNQGDYRCPLLRSNVTFFFNFVKDKCQICYPHVFVEVKDSLKMAMSVVPLDWMRMDPTACPGPAHRPERSLPLGCGGGRGTRAHAVRHRHASRPPRCPVAHRMPCHRSSCILASPCPYQLRPELTRSFDTAGRGRPEDFFLHWLTRIANWGTEISRKNLRRNAVEEKSGIGGPQKEKRFCGV
jgi:hypothetical protein